MESLFPKWRRLGIGTLRAAAMTLAISGCNKSSTPAGDNSQGTSGASSTDQTAGAGNNALASGTTTQPATTQPALHTLSLVFVPLTVKVPATWDVEPEGSSVLLQGPLPNPVTVSTAAIQLARQPSLSQNEMQALIRGSQQEQAQDPTRIWLVGPIQRDTLTILQERRLPRVAATQSTSPALKNYVPLHWNTLIFIPNRRHDLDRYVLSFFDLDQQTYEANKSFLQGIIDSVAIDANDPLNGM